MANYFPVFVSSGSIQKMDNSERINPIHFYTTRSVSPTSGSYATRLGDPYFFQSNSADVTVTSNTVSSSVISFNLPARPETQYYIQESILAGTSATAATTGPRVSVERKNLSDGFFKIIAATSRTAVAIRNQGSADAQATASMTTTAANNTAVPIGIKGIFIQSSPTQDLTNTIKTVTAGGVSTTIKSGSVMYNHYAGMSSSVTPTTASNGPLGLLNGTLDTIRGGDLVESGAIGPYPAGATANGWLTKSFLSTTQITSSVLGTWDQVFFVPGSAKYLVNYFLRLSSPLVTTGVYHRISNTGATPAIYTGFLYSQTSSNNTVLVSSSTGSSAIVNNQAAGVPSVDSPRIYYGEVICDGGSSNNTIDISTEVNGSAVSCWSGSFVMYRRLDGGNMFSTKMVSPLSLFSGSTWNGISSHTNTLSSGRALAMISSSLPAIDPAFWNYKIKTETTYVTSNVATNINELAINLTGNGGATGWHLIIGYFGVGCSSVTNAVRLGNIFNSIADSSNIIEVPDTTTSVIHNYEGTSGAPTTTSPSSNIDNFYFAKHVILAKVNTAGTYTPTLAVSSSGAGISASMGPSIVFWKRFS